MRPPLETTKTTVAAHLDEINERLKAEGNRTIELYNSECVARYGRKLAKDAGHFQQ
jgi:tetrahydromethanopterin S-methyltransferase subunit G